MKTAQQIVKQLLEGGHSMAKVIESPQYYPGSIQYQSDSKFLRISMRNFGDYVSLDSKDGYDYAVHPHLTTGFVFLSDDILKKPSLGMIPVMTVSLRDTQIKGYRQAHHLRIREKFSIQGVATNWYFSYVQKFGGIVSDFEHLEGGKQLWKSFVRTAQNKGFKISLVDSRTNTWTSLNPDTVESAIWSRDKTLRPFVLVLEQ